MSTYTQSISDRSRSSRARRVSSHSPRLTGSSYTAPSSSHRRGPLNAGPYAQSNVSYSTSSPSQAPPVEPQSQGYAESEYTYYTGTETDSQAFSNEARSTYSGSRRFVNIPQVQQAPTEGYARTSTFTDYDDSYYDTHTQSSRSYTTSDASSRARQAATERVRPRDSHDSGTPRPPSQYRRFSKQRSLTPSRMQTGGFFVSVKDLVGSVLSGPDVRSSNVAGPRNVSRDMRKIPSGDVRTQPGRQSRSLSRGEHARRSTAAPKAISAPHQARYDPEGRMQQWVNAVPEWEIQDDDMDPYKAMPKRSTNDSICASSRGGEGRPSSRRDPSLTPSQMYRMSGGLGEVAPSVHSRLTAALPTPRRRASSRHTQYTRATSRSLTPAPFEQNWHPQEQFPPEFQQYEPNHHDPRPQYQEHHGCGRRGPQQPFEYGYGYPQQAPDGFAGYHPATSSEYAHPGYNFQQPPPWAPYGQVPVSDQRRRSKPHISHRRSQSEPSKWFMLHFSKPESQGKSRKAKTPTAPSSTGSTSKRPSVVNYYTQNIYQFPQGQTSASSSSSNRSRSRRPGSSGPASVSSRTTASSRSAGRPKLLQDRQPSPFSFNSRPGKRGGPGSAIVPR